MELYYGIIGTANCCLMCELQMPATPYQMLAGPVRVCGEG